ncbi:hypothetical protein E2C01_095016 [Portunus trituberculatus]|uniref:Uncharacterized protein n=1 Tax=Portunus trituberculatus TaxID=210409 RepID=A0A5B7JU12_PORTR|nr:hypothetical protein [Portunus trituberculatus]
MDVSDFDTSLVQVPLAPHLKVPPGLLSLPAILQSHQVGNVCVCVFHCLICCSLRRDSQTLPYGTSSELIISDLRIGLRPGTHHTAGSQLLDLHPPIPTHC